MTVNNKPSTGRRPPHSRRGPKAAESGSQGWRAGPWLGLVKVQLEKQPEHGADWAWQESWAVLELSDSDWSHFSSLFGRLCRLLSLISEH